MAAIESDHSNSNITRTEEAVSATKVTVKLRAAATAAAMAVAAAMNTAAMFQNRNINNIKIAIDFSIGLKRAWFLAY